MATRKIAVIIGSLRKESFNRKVGKTLMLLAPPALEMEIVEIGQLALYNQDDDASPPATYVEFREKMKQFDGVLFCTPEYNRSVPAALKNAIDVGSRPYGKSSFLGKPTGIISNSPGPLGGVSAAKHLQNILPGISGPIMGQPEIYLNGIGAAFDDKGQLTSEPVQKLLQQYLEAFAAFVEKLNK